MGLTRKVQILAALEDTEGVAKTLTPSDTTLVFDPEVSEVATRNERVPASPALGRRKDRVGLTGRQISFGSDFGGGGVGTAPSWNKFMRSCGFQEQRVKKYALTSVGSVFLIGEKVFVQGAEATNYGIALNQLGGSSGNLYVAWLVGDAPAGTIEGKGSGATGTAAAPAAQDDFFYNPASLKLAQIQASGGWSSGPTLAVGSVVLAQRGVSGLIVGSGQVKINNSTPAGDWDDFEVSITHGDIQSGDILITAFGETATVSATPVQTRIPSLTMRHNLDGYARDLIGCRGNFTLEGSAGGPMRLNWTFQGVQASTVDLDFSPGAMFQTNLPPRLRGITANLIVAGSGITIPIRSVSIDMGNVVSLREDAVAAGGQHHAEVTDRDPTFTLTTDKLPVAVVPWVALRDLGSDVIMGLRIGTVGGNILTIVGTAMQIEEPSDEDAQGIAADSITLKPRMMDDGVIAEEGNNEIIIAQQSGLT